MKTTTRMETLWVAVAMVLSAMMTMPVSEAFVISSSPRPPATQPSSSLLQAKKVKRSGLADIAEAGGLGTTTSSSSRNRRLTSSSSSNSKKTSSTSASTANIAPGLAEWVATQKGSNASENDSDTNEDTAVGNVGTKSRRIKQSDRLEASDVVVQSEQIQNILDQLDAALQQNNNLAGILAVVSQLLEVPSSSTNLRQILASKPEKGQQKQSQQSQHNYRLAWVGSDEALCHIGTGLHKVPLARMQEVFLSCLGRNRVEILEVISITGPFPNVRNTLQGSTKITTNNKSGSGSSKMAVAAIDHTNGAVVVDNLRITMDSMVDGTGKELLAPGEKARIVDFQVYFSDRRALVAVVPPKEEDADESQDPLRNDGANVLVFVKEDEFDEKLDAWRVS